eukprot:13259-Prorocentrum_minimum.AAC.1
MYRVEPQWARVLLFAEGTNKLGVHDPALKGNPRRTGESHRIAYVLSPLRRLVPATGRFYIPFCDWCPLRVDSISPSVIGARYGYIRGRRRD